MRSRRERATLAAGTLVAGSAAGLWLVYVLTVRTAPGQLFGDATLRGASLSSGTFTAPVQSVLAVVSVASLLAGVAAVALIALVRLQRLPGLLAVGVVAASNGTTWVLKREILSRPDLGFAQVTPATHNSLPSGHVTAVFSVVIALLFVLPVGTRRVAGIAGVAWVTLTGLAVVSAGWHRAGDAVAALTVVAGWAGVASAVLAWQLPSTAVPRTEQLPSRRNGRYRSLRLGWVGLSLLGLLLLVVPGIRPTRFGEVIAFVLAGMLVVTSADLALRAVLKVLGQVDARGGVHS